MYALCSDAWMGALKRAIAAAEAAPAQQEEEEEEEQQQQQRHELEGPAGDPAAHAAQQQAQLGGSSNEADDEEVEVQQADFLAAVATVQPSLSVEEVAKYEAIRDEYESQATKARRY